MLDQGSDVVRHILEAERAINVGSVTVPLQFDNDYLMVIGKGWHCRKGRERFGSTEAAVKDHQRIPGAMRFVVEVDAVHRRIIAFCACCQSDFSVSYLSG